MSRFSETEIELLYPQLVMILQSANAFLQSSKNNLIFKDCQKNTCSNRNIDIYIYRC